MAKTVESHAHREMREAIRRITLGVKNLKVNEFDLQQLKALNIRIDPISLNENSPHRPTFFAPYPSGLMPETDDNALGGAYNGVDDDEPDSFFHSYYSCPNDRAYAVNNHLMSYISWCHTLHKGTEIPWTSGCPGDYPFTGLDKDEQPNHACFAITDMDGPTHPHVKAIMLNNMVASESTILCGELLPALRVMLMQFKKTRFLRQMVAPVMIISLMGLKARVIEFYFSNNSLVVRPTKMFDFTHANDAAFKTLAQMYLGKPIGDTVQGV
ncbi:hypothetical protein BJX76DRAFT_63937 [Aspergillus varians]